MILGSGQTATSKIMIYDAPKEGCLTCPVKRCNGKSTTKAVLSTDVELNHAQWIEYLQEIGANCHPSLERL